MTECELETAVGDALSAPGNPGLIDRVGAAWLRKVASDLVESERQRRRQEEILRQARERVDELREKAAEAAAALSAARAKRSQLEEELRRSWNARQSAEALAQAEAALTLHQPLVLRAADEERRWRAELELAERALQELEVAES